MAKKTLGLTRREFGLLFVGFIVFVSAVVLYLGGGQLVAKGPSKPTPLSVQISVVSPNGGEKLIQGQANIISWKGGYRAVAVGLATIDADTNHAIAIPLPDEGATTTPYSGPQTNGTTGKVIGFIKTTENGGVHLPNSSIAWDGLEVCNFHLNLDPDQWCKDVTPGNYKIFVWSQGEGGQSMCIASGEGPTGKYTKNTPKGCNWDLSDQAFSITVQ